MRSSLSCLLLTVLSAVFSQTHAFMISEIFLPVNLEEEATPTRSPGQRPPSVPTDDDNAPQIVADSPSIASLPSDFPSIIPSDQPSTAPSNVPSVMPSDLPSLMPSASATLSFSVAPSAAATSTMAMEAQSSNNNTLGVDYHYGSTVYSDIDGVVFTCGGVPLDGINASTSTVAYSIPYTYQLQVDESYIASQAANVNPMYLIQKTIDTLQSLILDTTLYSACNLRQVLYDDREAIGLAATKRDTPVGECGNYCLVVQGSISSYLDDNHGIVACNALQQVHGMLASSRITNLTGVSDVTPDDSTASNPILCLPETIASNNVASAVDDFNVNRYYNCDGARRSVSTDSEPLEIDYQYTLTVTDSDVDFYRVVAAIDQLLYYAILESSCYTAAAVKKDDSLLVTASPSDSVASPCGDQCFNITGAVSFQFDDEYGLVECAIINALFNAFQSDAIGNLEGVESVAFGSEDLLYTCIRNDLRDDPDYDPSNAFGQSDTSSMAATTTTTGNAIQQQATSIAVGGVMGFVATGALLVLVMLASGRKSKQRRGVQAEMQLDDDDSESMEPEEECTPRKLFGGDECESSRDAPGIRYADFETSVVSENDGSWIN
ncbi:hypothetical protein MPSEU_000584800 [Mayamaea pseudoterrestris]|nr:hypothetical protein MPSEU_000584800 [Mayamaea pseudoterrestris]